ncbi:GerMN domain-containing protein [Cohnella nanjingensis]|uniref:GerMN domain-containing protein n=1 Tax=Cohnella nanjingensis TaxID=1387779 RepID=A0A7X0VH63_9BACL|nr:GerMN domain-containing protein [Cohnella nanjingensis]MBB6672324.1 GerMN domain-containing protein [Cohnella nanjingensis]
MISNAMRSRSAKLLASAGLALVIAGCSFTGTQGAKTEPIDQPPADVESQMLQATEQQPASAGVADGLTVYLQDRNGFVAPMTLSRPQSENLESEGAASPEETALSWMTADPKLAQQLPPGFTPILPQGTKIKSVDKDLETGIVTIDFASPLPAIPASQERKAVEALVWTMTELPGVEKVRLELDGKPLTAMPASGLPLASVLTRDMGINLEQAAGVQASRSMAVTLYFSAKTAEGEGYFVPVTRLVERQTDRARAALNELIKGPSDTKKLDPVLVAGTSVEQLSVLSDTVVVKLQEKGWAPKLPVPEVPADMMQALVLTMTEATKAPKVQLALNGNTELLDSDNRSYAQPVTRPTQINALSR